MFLDKHSNKLTIISLNVDSLNSKFDELNILVNTLTKSDEFCKSINRLCISESGILATKLSDHMALFSALNFNMSKNNKIADRVCKRSFTNNNIAKCIEECDFVDWTTVFDRNTTADPSITCDEQFSVKLDYIINNCFPLKNIKLNKYKHTKSKWMRVSFSTK